LFETDYCFQQFEGKLHRDQRLAETQKQKHSMALPLKVGLWKVAINRHLVRIVVIDVLFYFYLAAILE
jgi:hypothetical protein